LYYQFQRDARYSCTTTLAFCVTDKFPAVPVTVAIWIPGFLNLPLRGKIRGFCPADVQDIAEFYHRLAVF
jgi:hypothetical protein